MFGVGRVDLDDVVVEALRTAVVGDVVLAGSAGQQRPAAALVGGLPDPASVVRVARGVDVVEAGVEHRRLPGRVGQADREAGARRPRSRRRPAARS